MFTIQIKNAVCKIEPPEIADNDKRPDNQSIINEICNLITTEYRQTKDDYPPT